MGVTAEQVKQMIRQETDRALGRLNADEERIRLAESERRQKREQAELKEAKRDRRAMRDVYESLGMDRKTAKIAARGRDFKGL